MSNSITRSGIAPNNASHRHLFQCAAVALAFAAATVVTMPKLETAAVGATDSGAPVASKLAASKPIDQTAAGCAQTWPYYERSCLRDSRQHDGKTRSVRVIATGEPSAHRASHQ